MPQKSIGMFVVSPSTLSIFTEREMVSSSQTKGTNRLSLYKVWSWLDLVLIELHMHRPVGMSKLLKASPDTLGTAGVALSLPLLPIQVPRRAAFTAHV